MSEEQLKAFIAKIQSDDLLQKQLKAEGADVLAIAKAAGFSLSKDDLALCQHNISDAELETSAGGGRTDVPTCSNECCTYFNC